MLVDTRALVQTYEEVKQRAGSSQAAVLMLVANDVDSLCAARMMQALLAMDHISFRITPVAGYLDFRSVFEQQVADDENLRTIICLNCGGVLHLPDLLPLEGRDIKVVVFDSNRPIYHTSINSSQQIIVVDDQYVVVDAGRDVPADHDSDEGFDDEATDEEDSSDDEEGSGAAAVPGSPLGGHKRKRRVRRRDGASSEEEEDEEEARSALAPAGSRAARKLSRAGRKRRWKRYYGRGMYHGFPVSHIVWQLVARLHRQRNDLLWLAIVGVTHALLARRLEQALYDDARADLERAVLMLNDPTGAAAPGVVAAASGGAPAAGMAGLPAALAGALVQGSAAVFDENGELRAPANAGGGGGVDPLSDGVAVMPAARLGHITACEELRFFLHRHSSLLTGMHLSPFLGPRMKLWVGDDDGATLKQLLARSGVPLKAASAPWEHMPSALKARVASKLVPTAQADPRFELGGLVYASFTLQRGYAAPMGAGDVAHATAALLECAKSLTMTRAQEDGDAAAASAAGGAEAPAAARPGDSSGPKEAVTWRDNFWTAFEALGPREPGLLAQGLELAQTVQAAVVRLGPYLVRTAHQFTFNGAVRTCKITELTDADRHIFTQPQALERLGRFLVDHHQQGLKEWNRAEGAAGITSPTNIAKPLVMLALNTETAFYTVVGIQVPSLDVEDSGSFSRLAEVMRTAGDNAGARFIMDTFDSTCIWIHRDFVDAFLDQLCFRIITGYDTAAIAAGAAPAAPLPVPPPDSADESDDGDASSAGGSDGGSDSGSDGGSVGEEGEGGADGVPHPASEGGDSLPAAGGDASGSPDSAATLSLTAGVVPATETEQEGVLDELDEDALLALLDDVETSFQQ